MSKKRKTRVYLAGPWFTPDAAIIHRFAKDVIKSCDKVIGIFPDEMSKGCTPRQTFDNNVEAIKNCDLVIALVDVKDVGTAWEIGMAYKLNKKIVLLGVDEDTFKSKTNLMLAFTGTTLSAKYLKDYLDDPTQFTPYYVYSETNWEGIE